VVLFVLEFTVTSHGLLTVGGIICFALGASALYTAPGTPVAPAISVDPRIIVALTAVTAGYMLFILTVVVRWRRSRLLDPLMTSTGPTFGQGAVAEVRTVLAPLGVVYAGGEEWSARAAEGLAIPSGATVRIVGQDGLTLIVEPMDSPG
jgi:membrane-bound serine protease (ClpP class)